MLNESIQKHRPHLHFAPEMGWMNDPNGLVYFKGEYHLFFQHNPADSVWGPMHWGHAVSKDLITWKELDIALYPDELGAIFSGSAVVDWNNSTGFFPDGPGLVAIFTHHLEGEGEPVQSQSLAYSRDKGRTWTKYEGNPVLEDEGKVDFRDPKVFWHKDTSRWVMVLASGQTISLYSSRDMKEWRFESEFGEGVGNHDGVWECPDLFTLGESRWVMLVSIGDEPGFDSGSRTQYFVGDFDGKTFEPEHEDVRWLDVGKDNYAGVSFSDVPESDGRRIYIGWMSNWQYANQVPTHGWRSQMTLPRELELKEDRLVQRPVRELQAYFEQGEPAAFTLDSKEEKMELSGDVESLQVTASLVNDGAERFGLIFHYDDDQFVVLRFDRRSERMVLDRGQSGNIEFSDHFKTKQSAVIGDLDSVELQVILDASSVEVFVNGGECALTSLVYPDGGCRSVSWFAEGGCVSVRSSVGVGE